MKMTCTKTDKACLNGTSVLSIELFFFPGQLARSHMAVNIPHQVNHFEKIKNVSATDHL